MFGMKHSCADDMHVEKIMQKCWEGTGTKRLLLQYLILSCENELVFFLRENKKSRSYQWFRIQPRFGTEALDNPEMGYARDIIYAKTWNDPLYIFLLEKAK